MTIEYAMLAGGAVLLGWEVWSWVERQGGASRFFNWATVDTGSESEARLDAVQALDDVLVDCKRYGWTEAGNHAKAAVRALYAEGET